jgi:hypothetical protein
VSDRAFMRAGTFLFYGVAHAVEEEERTGEG